MKLRDLVETLNAAGAVTRAFVTMVDSLLDTKGWACNRGGFFKMKKAYVKKPKRGKKRSAENASAF